MAVRAYTIEYESLTCKVIKWAGLTNTTTDTGAPYVLAGKYADKNAQVIGTLGAGGKCTIQGCNQVSGTDWTALHDQSGGVLDMSALGVKQVLENTLQIRPAITAGDGTTNLTCYIVIRK